MKKEIHSVIVLALLLMLSACNDDTLNSTDIDLNNINTTSSTSIENIIKNDTQEKTSNAINIEPTKNGAIYIGDKEAIEKAKAIPMSEWEGPFQATASRTVIYEDIQHYIDYVSGLASSVYWVDFLSYKATATLSPETVAYVEEPTPVGWSDIVNRKSGITTSHVNGNGFTTLIIETFSVHVKHNLAGQSIDIEYPSGLTDGFEYTYYYREYP